MTCYFHVSFLKLAIPTQHHAQEGMKITWFLSGPSPATWGRVVDGKIEAVGKAIAAKAARSAGATGATGAKAEAKAEAKVTELSMVRFRSW